MTDEVYTGDAWFWDHIEALEKRKDKPNEYGVPPEILSREQANQICHVARRFLQEVKRLEDRTFVSHQMADARLDVMHQQQEEIERLQAELAERDASFELRWSADMRAITRWRAEDPQPRDLIMPDHADLVVWLLKRLEAEAELLAEARKEYLAGLGFQGSPGHQDGWDSAVEFFRGSDA